jgi:hypothetical protein
MYIIFKPQKKLYILVAEKIIEIVKHVMGENAVIVDIFVRIGKYEIVETQSVNIKNKNKSSKRPKVRPV